MIELLMASGKLFPRYQLSANRTTINEGQSVIFSITTKNVPNGTVLYWTTTGTATAGDFTDNRSTNSVVINNNNATVTRTLKEDVLTEGVETFILQLRTGSISGEIVALSQSVRVNDTSVAPTYSISPNRTSVSEGNSVIFTVTTQHVPNGTILYWTTNGTAKVADFTDGLIRNTITINSNKATITRELANDFTSEGEETFGIEIRTGSYTGPIVASRSGIIIEDTSKTPLTIGQAIHGGYYFGPSPNFPAHGLILAPKNSEVLRNWGLDANFAVNDPWYGLLNTNQMTSTSYPAGSYCRNYRQGGFSDWYLMSSREMRTMIDNLDPTITTLPAIFRPGGSQVLSDQNYLCSTYFDLTRAQMMSYVMKYLYVTPKSMQHLVRPIRRVLL